jgi:Protein kinase domain
VVAPLTSDQPRTIGPYHLVGQLGHGGLGPVFLGRSPGGATVAVKVIRAELAADPWFRTQFRAEIDAARKVNGAFVTPVADADLDGDVPWLATEYVVGRSLAETVRERGPLPYGPLVALAAGLAEGLVAVHAAGVVHGNLHPGNVLLAADGPRVADFGISQAAAASGLPDVDFGSPEFLSPEQVLGQDTGPASDIFSLGSVLIFAGSGQGPFGSGTSAALMYRLVNSPADVGGLPSELQELVASCLARQPEDRPSASRLQAGFGDIQVRAGGSSRAGGLAWPVRAGESASASATVGVAAATADGVSAPAAAPAAVGTSWAGPWSGSEGGGREHLRRRGRFWPSTPAWITGGLLAAAAAAIIILTGAVPSSPAGQAHAGAVVAGPASTSQSPIISTSSHSGDSGSSPLGGSSLSGNPDPSESGSSASLNPALLGPSASSLLSPSTPPSVPPSSSAPSSGSASPKPSKSQSPSPSPSPSQSPSPSPSPSSSPPASPSPSPSSASPSPSSASPSPSTASSSPSSASSSPAAASSSPSASAGASTGSG